RLADAGIRGLRMIHSYVLSMAIGVASGSILVSGRPKAIFGYTLVNVSIVTSIRAGALGSSHRATSPSSTWLLFKILKPGIPNACATRAKSGVSYPHSVD